MTEQYTKQQLHEAFSVEHMAHKQTQEALKRANRMIASERYEKEFWWKRWSELHMMNIPKISEFLNRYYGKYPAEIENDYSMTQISDMIESGYSYYLGEHIFIIYQNDIIETYYCDMDGYSLVTVAKIVREHHKVMEMLGKPYIRGIKEYFKKMVQYDTEKNMWRFI